MTSRFLKGDIIKIPDDYEVFGINAGEIYEVYFAFGGFKLKPEYSKATGCGLEDDRTVEWFEDDRTVELIGNICDNPELIDGENKD